MKLEDIKPFEPHERATFSFVRRVGPHLVKTPAYRACIFADPLDHLKTDYDVNLDLYRRGVSVPKPFKFYDDGGRIKAGNHYVTFQGPAFVREFIPGMRVSDADGQLKKQLMKQMFRELGTAESLGYELPLDSETGNNAIVTPDFKRIVLIDFGNWDHKGIS